MEKIEKKIVIKITSCIECFNKEDWWSECGKLTEERCLAYPIDDQLQSKPRLIEDSTTIPDWCPL